MSIIKKSVSTEIAAYLALILLCLFLFVLLQWYEYQQHSFIIDIFKEFSYGNIVTGLIFCALYILIFAITIVFFILLCSFFFIVFMSSKHDLFKIDLKQSDRNRILVIAAILYCLFQMACIYSIWSGDFAILSISPFPVYELLHKWEGEDFIILSKHPFTSTIVKIIFTIFVIFIFRKMYFWFDEGNKTSK